MVLERQYDLVHAHLQPLGGGLDDPDVGLVRHQPVNGAPVELVRGQRLVDDALECPDRDLEDLVALHLDVRPLQVARPLGLRRAVRVIKEIAMTAICAEVAGQDAGRFGRLQHHCSGTVAEQDAGRSILPVDDARQGLGADHQRTLRGAAGNEAVGHAQRIDETAAGRLDAERRASRDAEAPLDQAAHVGEDEVRGGRADHDKIDLVGRHAGRFHGLARGLLGKITGGLAIRGQVPPLDARARGDPLLGGVHHRLELAIGQDSFRQVAAGAGNAGIPHATCSPNNVLIWSGTRFSASTLATDTACWNARLSAPPWLLMTTPFRPTRLAPL